MYPAPFFNNNAAVGKATNVGINVTEPIIAAIITPINPDFSPIIDDILSGNNIVSMIPTINIIVKN